MITSKAPRRSESCPEPIWQQQRTEAVRSTTRAETGAGRFSRKVTPRRRSSAARGKESPQTGVLASLTMEQAQRYEKDLLSGKVTEDSISALILADPELAQEAAQSDNLSRKMLDRLLGKMTGNPRKRGHGEKQRQKIHEELVWRSQDIAAEIESRSEKGTGQTVSRVPIQTPAGQPTRIAGRGARGRFTSVPGMSDFEAEAQQRRSDEERLTDEPVILTDIDRESVDKALNQELEQNGRDLLRDTSLSNRQVARELPPWTSFAKRLARCVSYEGGGVSRMPSPLVSPARLWRVDPPPSKRQRGNSSRKNLMSNKRHERKRRPRSGASSLVKSQTCKKRLLKKSRTLGLLMSIWKTPQSFFLTSK